MAQRPKTPYLYDATGTKLAKVLSNPTTSVTYYAGNYIYHGNNVPNAELKFFGQPEGYVEPVAGTNKETRGFTGGHTTYSSYNYVFQFTDHLGNVRLSYGDANLDGAIDLTSEIIEENNYYPFGLKQKGYNLVVQGGSDIAQQWKFNGVQKNEDLGVNLYEMDLRQYDPAIARWIAVDPVTHHSMSTYTAFDNNPVFWADPSGADSGVSSREGFYNQKVWSADEKTYLYQYNQPNYLAGYDRSDHTTPVGFGDLGNHFGWGNTRGDTGSAVQNINPYELYFSLARASGQDIIDGILGVGKGISGFYGDVGDFFSSPIDTTVNYFSKNPEKLLAPVQLYGLTIGAIVNSLQTINSILTDASEGDFSSAGETYGRFFGQVSLDVGITAATAGLGAGFGAASKSYASINYSTGGIRQWFRVGKSKSIKGDFNTYGAQWGASRNWISKVKNHKLRAKNRNLRNRILPWNGWRFQDPGHFHFWERK